MHGRVCRLNGAREDYRAWEHVAHVALAGAPLSAEAGTLTRTLKLRRPQVLAAHAAEVDALLHTLRG